MLLLVLVILGQLLSDWGAGRLQPATEPATEPATTLEPSSEPTSEPSSEPSSEPATEPAILPQPTGSLPENQSASRL